VQQQADYLLQLPPAQLPVLLKQALNPSLLAAATAALLQQGARQDPAAAVALLEGLTGVARFDINLLSVPSRQKGELQAAWDAAAAQLDAALAGRLANVRSKYKF
jgi:Meckel syndrome type 1 protein